MIQPDNTGASLATQGFAGIDQQKALKEQARQQAMPIPQALADYYQRMMNGEDPAALGAEARNHPEIQGHVESLRAGSQLQPPQVSHVGPGAGGPGQPALYTPQGTRDDMPPMQGLSDVQRQSHGQSQQAVGYSPPSLAGGVGDGGASFMHGARTQQPAQPPMGSMSQGSPSLSMPQQPGGGPQIARQDFGTPKFKGGDTISYKDAPQFAQAASQAAGINSREQIAREAAKVKEVVQSTKSDMALQIAQLKAQGVDDATLVKLMLGTMGEQGKQERFVEGEKGRTKRNENSADALRFGAKSRADGKEDPAEKELRSLQSEMGAVVSKPDWTKDPASVAEASRIQARIGELHRLVGREGPSSPGPLQGPAAPGATSGPGKTPDPSKKPKPSGKEPAAGAASVRYSKSRNLTQWLDARGTVIKEAQGDKR